MVHCDSPGDKASRTARPTAAPRAEAPPRQGLLTPGDADYFARGPGQPLRPHAQNLQTCGEYRLVYAKWSGRDNPANRLFIIFEGALPNLSPGNVFGCHAAALHWASLEEARGYAQIRAALEAFLFDGLPGLAPLVDPRPISASCRARVTLMAPPRAGALEPAHAGALGDAPSPFSSPPCSTRAKASPTSSRSPSRTTRSPPSSARWASARPRGFRAPS